MRDLIDTRFSTPARLLHWIVAAAIPFQVYLGWAAEWEETRDESIRLIRNHYQLGVVIFSLMLMRVLWRISHGAPPIRQVASRPERTIAGIVHWLLYGLLLTMPLSGYVIWVWMDAPMDVLGIIDVPRLFTPPVQDESGRALAWYFHFYSSWAIIALTALHIAAALRHQFIRRDGGISARML